jgi:DNA-binding IclR family transcriptional regulator
MAIQSVDRTVSILRQFAPDVHLLGGTELSRMLGMDRSAIQRSIASLVEADLLERDPVSGKYRLGLGLLELAGTMLKSRSLPDVTRPYLRYVADQVGESAYLGCLYDNSVLEIVDVPSVQLVQYSGWMGRRLPLHCTSSGKTLLASLPPERLEQLLATLDLPAMTARTITDRDQLRAELARIREQGYATDFGEYEEGSHAVAVPLLSGGSWAPIEIAVVGPAYRFTEEKARQSTAALAAVARELSNSFSSSILQWIQYERSEDSER